MWHKIPNVIILSAFETYTSLHLPTFSLTNSAFLLASLLNASIACATKQKTDAFILVSCQSGSVTEENQLQVLNKTYLQHIVKDRDFENQDDIVNKICELLKVNRSLVFLFTHIHSVKLTMNQLFLLLITISYFYKYTANKIHICVV